MKTLTIALICMTAALTTAWAEPVRYRVEGEEYEGYYVTPSEDAPLVIIIHDWDGLTDYEIRRARMLKEAGYAVFAADMFGAGVRPTALKDKQQLTGALYKDRGKMRRLVQGALKAAEAQGARVENAVAMGYCFGGTVVLEWARSGADLKGFVPFHGGLDTPEGQDYTRTSGFVLVFHGTADKHVTMESFAGLAMALEKAEVPHEMITYGGAPHAFSVFGSDRYREGADQKSWARFKAFLEEALQ